MPIRQEACSKGAPTLSSLYVLTDQFPHSTLATSKFSYKNQFLSKSVVVLTVAVFHS